MPQRNAEEKMIPQIEPTEGRRRDANAAAAGGGPEKEAMEAEDDVRLETEANEGRRRRAVVSVGAGRGRRDGTRAGPRGRRRRTGAAGATRRPRRPTDLTAAFQPPKTEGAAGHRESGDERSGRIAGTARGRTGEIVPRLASERAEPPHLASPRLAGVPRDGRRRRAPHRPSGARAALCEDPGGPHGRRRRGDATGSATGAAASRFGYMAAGWHARAAKERSGLRKDLCQKKTHNRSGNLCQNRCQSWRRPRPTTGQCATVSQLSTQTNDGAQVSRPVEPSRTRPLGSRAAQGKEAGPARAGSDHA